MHNIRIRLVTFTLTVFSIAAFAMAEEEYRIDVAEFDDDGDLIVPTDLDEWIFIGSSLGMGYSQDNFDPDSPGMFQVARMEPTAYKVFKKTGKFADGTMLSLHFYGSANHISINRSGFVMSDLHFAEIHYKDSKRFPDGFNFYNLSNGEPTGREIELPNDCVDCHKRDGAYDGVFVQFYPTIREYLPQHIQAKLAESSPASGH
jgi:Cytochrome P460